jgi:hypothetical protein
VDAVSIFFSFDYFLLTFQRISKFLSALSYTGVKVDTLDCRPSSGTNVLILVYGALAQQKVVRNFVQSLLINPSADAPIINDGL